MDPDPLPETLFLLLTISPTLIGGIVFMLILLTCSAFISGAEVAYFSIEPKDIEELKNAKSKASDTVLEQLEKPKKLLATILIANNFVNVGIVVLSSFLASSFLSFSDFILFNYVVSAVMQEFIVLVVLVTFMILLAGEVVPKVYANKYPLKLAEIMAYPLFVFDKVFWTIGLSRFLIYSTSLIHKRISKKSNNISVDELSHVLDLTDGGDVSQNDQKILEGIVKFGSTDVKQIMKPRVDVFALNIESSYNEILPLILEHGFSRIPVFTESFDKVEGILYVKDLLSFLNKEDQFNWQSLIRKPYFVPESKKIDDLLADFQEKRIHLALVVDEYGGNAGIITLEDIIEEIVGEITDEFDEEEIGFTKINSTNYIFEGKTPLKDIYRVLDINGDNFENQKGDSDTIAGFLLELSGKIMLKNEKVSFDNYTFTIESSDKRRIKSVKITVNDPSTEAN